MPEYEVSFCKNLLSSDGHQFKCVQDKISTEAPNEAAAVQIAKGLFEQRRRFCHWRLYADVVEVTRSGRH